MGPHPLLRPMSFSIFFCVDPFTNLLVHVHPFGRKPTVAVRAGHPPVTGCENCISDIFEMSVVLAIIYWLQWAGLDVTGT